MYFLKMKMNFEYPDFFARFYDLIYHNIRDGVDNQFFLDQIRNTEGKVLEIGVGTGRLFSDALSEGADIYGIDVSPSMIEILKGKLDPAVQNRVSIQNMIDFDLDHQFDLIIAPFRVFMHLLTKKDQLQALNNVHKYLTEGGKFIFDVFIPNLNYLIKGLDEQEDFSAEYEPGRIFKRFVSTEPDLIEQIINVKFRFEWEEDDQWYVKKWKLLLRFYFRFELEHLIERSAFNGYQVLGDYLGNELNKDSKEFILICYK